MKGRLCLAAALLMCCTLCACGGVDLAWLGGGNVEDMLRAPRTDQRQSAVQSALNGYLGETLQLKYPRGGSEPDPVIFADLDGDGAEEAAVLYVSPSKGQNVHLSVLEQRDGAWAVAYEVMGLSTEVAEVQLAEVFPGSTQLLVGFANAGLTDKFLELYDYRDVTIYSACRQPYSACWLGALSGGMRLAAAVAPQEPGGVSSLQLFAPEGRAMKPVQAVELDARFERCTALSRTSDGPREGFAVDGQTADGFVSQIVRLSGDELSPCLAEESDEPVCYTRPRALAALAPRAFDESGELLCASAGQAIATLRSADRFYAVDWMNSLRARPLRRFGVWDDRCGFFLRLPESWRGGIALVEQSDTSWQVLRRGDGALLCTVLLTPEDSPLEEPDGAVRVGGSRVRLIFGEACAAAQAKIIENGVTVF